MAPVRKLAAQGRIVRMMMHDLTMAACCADQLVGMRDGRIPAVGAPPAVVTPTLVQQLYDVQSHLLFAPGDAAPIVIAHGG